MAKRRRSSAARTQIVRVSAPPRRAPAPVIKLNVPRSAPVRRVGRRVRRAARYVAHRALDSRAIVVPLATAFVLGKLASSGELQKIPRVLGLGPIGSGAIIAYGVQKWLWKTDVARNLALTLGIIATYGYGATGQVSGDDVVGPVIGQGYPGGAAVFATY